MPVALAVPVTMHSPALPAHAQPLHAAARSVAAPSAKAPEKRPARTTKDVTVRAGDSVYSIARTHHSSVAAIAKANPRVQFRRLLPGTVLRVPVPQAAGKPAAAPASPTAKKPAPKPPSRPAPHPAKSPARTAKQVMIHRGDTLYVIAKREHVALASLIKANPGLNSRRLVPGSTIRIPVPASASRTTPATKPTSKATPKPTPKTAPARFAPKPSHVVRYSGTAAARRYPAGVVASGDRHRAQLAKADLPTREQIRSMITSTARQYGVNPTLALAIAWQESGHQQSAVSVCDALGTMQVMPTTGSWAGQIIDRKLNLLQAQDNITAGIVTLRYLTQHAANQDQVIGAYYQGLGAVRAHGFYPDTRRYVASVHAHMKRFS